MEQNEQNNSFERDEKGLLKSVEYKYKEDGSINWRAMLKPEHLVVQKDKKDKVEQVYGKKISELDITTIDDKYLLILLSGIKHLAALRQYKYVDQKVNYVSDQKAVVTCSIQFVGNFETNNQDVVFSDVASASINNTSGFGQLFLESIAANRAFVRAVRNFLNINIVGKDEIADNGVSSEIEVSNDQTDISHTGILQKKMDEKKISFEVLKQGALGKYKEEMKSNPEEWNVLADIPKIDCFTLLAKLSKIK